MRSQLFAALCFAALIAAGLTLGLIGAESHADGDGSATPTASEFAISDYIPAGPSGMEPNEDELFPLRPYALIPDRDGQVAYGEVERAPVLDQPIEYSHKLHAGTLQIQCEYCHTGARRGIHAGIPETETCMNCHKVIDSTDRPELEKLKAFILGCEPSGLDHRSFRDFFKRISSTSRLTLASCSSSRADSPSRLTFLLLFLCSSGSIIVILKPNSDNSKALNFPIIPDPIITMCAF